MQKLRILTDWLKQISQDILAPTVDDVYEAIAYGLCC